MNILKAQWDLVNTALFYNIPESLGPRNKDPPPGLSFSQGKPLLSWVFKSHLFQTKPQPLLSL